MEIVNKIAEKVRESINPELPKRMDSYFLFTNKSFRDEFIKHIKK